VKFCSTYLRLLLIILDLQSFREALAILQQQVDDLDELKARHYQEIMEHEEEIWDFAQGKVRLHDSSIYCALAIVSRCVW
jgi:hypothetical protein